MALTAAALIAASLRTIGVLASGENPSANEQTDALTALNDLIDSWSTEQLLIPNKLREVFPLVTNRAQRIENCLIQLAGNTPVLEIPMKILNKDEYASIIIKPLASTFPLYMYAEQAYPLDNLNFWPVPNTGVNNVVLYSWKPLAELALITTVLSLPPGYERALKFALAVELAPEFGKALSDNVAALAIESKAAIKRMNYRPNYLMVDKEIRAKPAVWNWLTGEPI